jgi:hypothetical protein
MNIIEKAKMALKLPDDYFSGEGEDTETWGRIGVSFNRDSSPAGKAIALEIFRIIEAEHPDDICWSDATHWLVGWVSEIKVRVLEEPGEVTLDNITDVFNFAVELAEEDNGFEDVVMEAEHEATINNIENVVGSSWTRIPDEMGSHDAAENVYRWLLQNDYWPGGDDNCWYDNDEIYLACHYLGYVETSDIWMDDYVEWMDDNITEEFLQTVKYFETVEKEKTQGRLL